ncbi:ATP-binding protein [Magnetospirillum sulfuroxidans]|uniref:histidine kinase n=1 Tax=Magnetospirillum sulfuroxidans TaxID=611300 RepID=A0ABS5I992_9PROT|nr:ATP-binding protein [Magnetospirillum sulfuroxidans]MBR9971006.1 response regulator [Magnetospirillum sulfuroxidans]
MPLTLRKSRIQTIIPVVAMNVAVLLGGVVWLAGEYSDKQISAQATLSALIRATTLNVAKTFEIASESLRSGGADQPIQSPLILTIDHQLRQSAIGQTTAIDVSDRDYARVLSQLEAGAAFPGTPVINPATGMPQWPLSLRVSSAAFSGLVRMLSMDEIQRPLETARIKPDGIAWIIRDDGTILAAAPWRAEMIGRNIAMIDPILAARASPERLRAVEIDGTAHLVTTSAVAGVPLRVVVAAPTAEFFIDLWREAGLLLALMTIMIATSIYSGRRQWLLLKQLEHLNTSLHQQVQSQSAVLDAEIKERQEHQTLARVLRNALEYSGTMVLITDVNGLIEYANPAFFKATDFELPDIIGKPPSMLRHRDLSPPASTLWPTILAGQTWSGMFCNRRRDGSPLWVSATISPVTDAAGSITHFVAVEEDATSRRDGEEELRQAKRSAEAASLAKSEFLSSMSHELRTPMNAILGFAQLLVNSDRDNLGERPRFYADSILKSGNHLLNLVNDILDMARIEAGRLSLSFERVQLQRVMADIMPMIATMAERRKVTLIDEISAQSAPILEADFTRLKQVLINLASNAVKYNRTGGTVRFSISHGETGPVRIAVSDSGIGIPEKRRSEVFTPFSRLGAEASSVEGTGIGLTISKMLVEAMGGQIDFFTQENLGTTFWLEIPRAARQSDAAGLQISAEATLPTGSTCQLTLLYIEDNPSNIELMEEIIAQDSCCRCRLLTATSAEEGLILARQYKPGLVIMDINLPGINGIEAVMRMKADPELRPIPVVALSADVMPDTIRNGMKAGFLRYLRKPLDIPEFRKILHQLSNVS